MNIEPLESRIAPAGVVTLSIAGTSLKVLGDDAANVFTVTQLEDGSVRFDASSGTQLRVGDNLQTAAQFTSAEGRSMSIELFAGSDEVIIAGLSHYKELKVDLGAGDDELSLSDISVGGKLDIKGGAGVNTVNLDGDFEVGGAFSYLGAEQADSILGNATSFRAASALIDLKGGNNTVSISEANALWQLIESFRVIAGSGNDMIELSGASASFGMLNVNLGDGSNSLNIRYSDIIISNIVKLSSGEGADVFDITAADNLTLRKGITANLGDGPGDFQLAAGGSLSVRGATTVNFGDALDGQTDASSARIGGRNVNLGPVSFSAGQDTRFDSLIAGYDVATGVAADNPARNITLGSFKVLGGAMTVMNATDTITVRGSANIYSNNPGGGLLGIVSLTAASLDIGKDLLFSDGAGDSEFTLAAESIIIGGKLALNLGDTATHESGLMLVEEGPHQIVNLGLPGGSLMAGSVLLASKNEVSIETLEIFASGRIETTGAFSVMDGGGSASVQFVDADLDIGKSFTLALGAGNSTVMMEGRLFRAGSVLFTSAAIASDWEDIALGWEHIEWGSLGVVGGAGASSFTLDANMGQIGNALIKLGAGANIAEIHSGVGLKAGKLGYLSSSGAAAVVEKLTFDGIASKEVKLVMGDAASRVAIINSRLGSLSVGTRGGADVLTVDDTVVFGQTFIDTGIEVENDETHIESDTGAGGASTFGGKFTLKLGKGDDIFSVAAAVIQTRARFFGAVEVDGGDGADTFTPHATNAVFVTAPVLTNVP